MRRVGLALILCFVFQSHGVSQKVCCLDKAVNSFLSKTKTSLGVSEATLLRSKMLINKNCYCLPELASSLWHRCAELIYVRPEWQCFREPYSRRIGLVYDLMQAADRHGLKCPNDMDFNEFEQGGDEAIRLMLGYGYDPIKNGRLRELVLGEKHKEVLDYILAGIDFTSEDEFGLQVPHYLLLDKRLVHGESETVGIGRARLGLLNDGERHFPLSSGIISRRVILNALIDRWVNFNERFTIPKAVAEEGHDGPYTVKPLLGLLEFVWPSDRACMQSLRPTPEDLTQYLSWCVDESSGRLDSVSRRYVDSLLEAGASSNATIVCSDGTKVAVLLAAVNRRLSTQRQGYKRELDTIIDTLLEHGALVAGDGGEAISLARKAGNIPMLTRLLETHRVQREEQGQQTELSPEIVSEFLRYGDIDAFEAILTSAGDNAVKRAFRHRDIVGLDPMDFVISGALRAMIKNIYKLRQRPMQIIRENLAQYIALSSEHFDLTDECHEPTFVGLKRKPQTKFEVLRDRLGIVVEPFVPEKKSEETDEVEPPSLLSLLACYLKKPDTVRALRGVDMSDIPNTLRDRVENSTFPLRVSVLPIEPVCGGGIPADA